VVRVSERAKAELRAGEALVFGWTGLLGGRRAAFVSRPAAEGRNQEQLGLPVARFASRGR
jgi:hypothetical protein